MSRVTQNKLVEQLYREYKDHVYSYVLRLTGEKELAADITQQTFVKLLGDVNLSQVQNPKAYLFTMARNALYDEWKRKKERLLHDGEEMQLAAMPDDPLDIPANQAEQQDMQDKVEQAIGLMKPKFRELMLLRYTEDLSVEEIAGITGRSTNDVKVNLHRARLSFDKDFTYLMYSRVAKSRERCNTIGELLTPYSEREMPSEQIEIVARHLGHCQLCAKDMDEMKRDRKLFAAIPFIVAPLAFDDLVPRAEAATATTNTASVTTKTVVGKAVVVKLVAGVVVATSIAVGSYLLLRQPVAVTPLPVATAPAPAPVAPIASPATPVPTTPATTTANPVTPAPTKPSPEVERVTKAEKPVQQVKPAEGKIQVKGLSYDGAPYVADTLSYGGRDGKRSQGKLMLSSKGMRVENSEDGKTIIFAVNFKSQKVWWIDPISKKYIEDDIDSNGNAKGDLAPVVRLFETDAGVNTQGIVFDQPCVGYTEKQKLGEETVLGRVTEKWQCNNKGKSGGEIDWYDPKIKLTIRSDSRGEINELQNIQFAEQPDSLFTAPAGYRKVAFEELFGVPSELLQSAIGRN